MFIVKFPVIVVVYVASRLVNGDEYISKNPKLFPFYERQPPTRGRDSQLSPGLPPWLRYSCWLPGFCYGLDSTVYELVLEQSAP